MTELHLEKWMQKTKAYYLDRLSRACKARQEKKCNIWSDIPEWKLFEWYVAIKQDQCCWSDLPKSVLAQMNLTTRQDNGVDLVSIDLKRTTQVKHYAPDTTVTQRSIATFVQWSMAILPNAEKQLVTLDTSMLSNTVKKILLPRLKIEHTTYNWDQIKQDVERWINEESEEGKHKKKTKRKRDEAKVNVDDESSSHGKQAKVETITKIKRKTSIVTKIQDDDENEEIESQTEREQKHRIDTTEITIKKKVTVTSIIKPEKTLSPLRPYQEEAMKAFDEKYEHHFYVENHENSDTMIFRFQAACGTGKTLFAIHLIQKDMERCPDTIEFPRYLFLCPWIDLAQQVAQEFRDNGFNSVCVVGGGSKLDADKSIWVCVYPSIININKFLEKNNKYQFRVIVVDEAHHIEQDRREKKKPLSDNKQLTDSDEDTVTDEDVENDTDNDSETEGEQPEEKEKDRNTWKMIIDKMETKVRLELSATFLIRSTVDFTYPFDKAVRDGFLTDYHIHVLYMSEGDRYTALCEQLSTQIADIAPVFLYFNTQENAKRCMKLLQQTLEKRGIVKDTCAILLGKDSVKDRQNILKKMTSGQITCLFLCGVFNEGLTFPNLRSIILGDMRFSKVNLCQILMRANRLHPDKAYAKIIIPIQKQHLGDNKKDLETLKPLSSFKELTTLCHILSDWDQRLYDEMKSRNFSRFSLILPISKSDKTIKEENEENEISFAEILKEEIYNRFGTAITIQPLSHKKKVSEMLDVMKIHKNSKIVFKPTSIMRFSDGSSIGSFWTCVKLRFEATQAPYSLLLENSILKKDYELSMSKREAKVGVKRLSPEQKAHELLSLLKENIDPRKLLTRSSAKKFSDRSRVESFWRYIIAQRKGNAFPYSLLLDNQALKREYELSLAKAEANSKRKKLSLEKKVDELLVLLDKNRDSYSIIKQRNNYQFSDGTLIGSFWNNVKVGRKATSPHYSRLLENSFLKKDYYSSKVKKRIKKKNEVKRT